MPWHHSFQLVCLPLYVFSVFSPMFVCLVSVLLYFDKGSLCRPGLSQTRDGGSKNVWMIVRGSVDQRLGKCRGSGAWRSSLEDQGLMLFLYVCFTSHTAELTTLRFLTPVFLGITAILRLTVELSMGLDL